MNSCVHHAYQPVNSRHAHHARNQHFVYGTWSTWRDDNKGSETRPRSNNLPCACRLKRRPPTPQEASPAEAQRARRKQAPRESSVPAIPEETLTPALRTCHAGGSSRITVRTPTSSSTELSTTCRGRGSRRSVGTSNSRRHVHTDTARPQQTLATNPWASSGKARTITVKLNKLLHHRSSSSGNTRSTLLHSLWLCPFSKNSGREKEPRDRAAFLRAQQSSKNVSSSFPELLRREISPQRRTWCVIILSGLQFSLILGPASFTTFRQGRALFTQFQQILRFELASFGKHRRPSLRRFERASSYSKAQRSHQHQPQERGASLSISSSSSTSSAGGGRKRRSVPRERVLAEALGFRSRN